MFISAMSINGLFLPLPIFYLIKFSYLTAPKEQRSPNPHKNHILFIFSSAVSTP